MAIIKLGTTVTGIRGHMGGIVFSANKSGPYSKPWHYPVNPRSTKQQTQRSLLQYLAQQWQALDPADKALWDAYAITDPEPTYNSLGELLTLTGYNYFTRCNSRLTQLEEAIITQPGTDIRPDPPTIDDLEAYAPGEGDLTITFSIAGSTADCALVIFLATAPYLAATPKLSAFRFADYYDPTASPYVSSTIIEDLFGALPAQMRLSARILQCNTTSGINSESDTDTVSLLS